MTNDPLDIQQHYKNVFGSPEGRIVLGDLLTLGHFSETLNPNDPVEIAEHNFAMVILRMCGGLDLIYTQLGIPVREEK